MMYEEYLVATPTSGELPTFPSQTFTAVCEITSILGLKGFKSIGRDSHEREMVVGSRSSLFNIGILLFI